MSDIVDKLLSKELIVIYFIIILTPPIIITTLTFKNIEQMLEPKIPLEKFLNEKTILVKDKIFFEKTISKQIIQSYNNDIFEVDPLDFQSINVNSTYNFLCNNPSNSLEQCIINEKTETLETPVSLFSLYIH